MIIQEQKTFLELSFWRFDFLILYKLGSLNKYVSRTMKSIKSKWLRSMKYILLTNLFLVVLVIFLFSFTVLFDNQVLFYFNLLDFIAIFFGLILYVGLVSLVITLVSSCVIGVPTVYVLKLLGRDKPIYAALVGALSVYYVMLASYEQHEWYFLFYCFFGFACGYAFMYGYNKEEKS